ncbi:ATP synthase F1 subunit delta [[Clostridium] polysaccharolyticum]|uniref:ATP synthase subunit delta n=1 Tax=[Clostridium] polysaccharolyticum TaxID=29364 RepID=A0A1H9ZXD6_9FIRM|nr:ATP synthase F1 subunit delta [[Clostridium] polysaccharolyticum]SES86467.1 F-type H+-transporting ATPase subunit delta [[Clostridium] polysaccharolyticum]
MAQIAINYAKALYQLGITPDTMKDTRRKYRKTQELQKALLSPVIPKQQKHQIIEKIFAPSVHGFLKLLCDYQSVNLLPQIFEAYKKIYYQENDVLAAELMYVTEPSEQQVQQFKNYLRKRFQKEKVHIRKIQDPALVGGFILKAGDLEMDWSLRGRFLRLEQKLVYGNSQ